MVVILRVSEEILERMAQKQGGSQECAEGAVA